MNERRRPPRPIPKPKPRRKGAEHAKRLLRMAEGLGARIDTSNQRPLEPGTVGDYCVVLEALGDCYWYRGEEGDELRHPVDGMAETREREEPTKPKPPHPPKESP